VLPALALAAGALAVPMYGDAAGDVTVAPAADHPAQPPRPKHCRLPPPSRQPKPDRAAIEEARRRADGAQLVVLHVPATTCNTPEQGAD